MRILGDRPVVKGECNLLGEGESSLLSKNMRPIRYIKDDFGKKAILYRSFILVAKQYVIDKNIVSVEQNLIFGAHKTGRDILVYIGDEKRFYCFTTDSIITSCFKTKRGRDTMLEFPIDIGMVWGLNNKEAIKKMDDWNRQLEFREHMSEHYCLKLGEHKK